MNVLISGGCKNGKTAFAQDIAVKLSCGGKRYYVATMIPFDDEDQARIARHIADRAEQGFETLETGRDIAACLKGTDHNAVFLVDSLTALLMNEMFPDVHCGEADPQAVERCREGLLQVEKEAKHVVFVTDYIYSDAARYDAFTEQYRRNLALLDRSLAAVCDTVVELCAGNVICHKGGLPR